MKITPQELSESARVAITTTGWNHAFCVETALLEDVVKRWTGMAGAS